MLTETQVKNAKPREKRYLIRDDYGLYLEIYPTGKRSWLFRYSIGKKAHKISLGQYPLISLKEARDRRDKARVQLIDGIAPDKKKKTADESEATFGSVLHEWLEKKILPSCSETYITHTQSRIKNHIIPFIGDRPIRTLRSSDILDLLRRIESKGHAYLAQRVNQICSQVFRYGIAVGVVEIDPTYGLKGAITTPPSKHLSSITSPNEVGQLMRAIDAYPYIAVRCALQFSALTFCRPGEIRHAEWAEITGDEWRIPEEKMKMRRPHIVPLSQQAIGILEKMRQLTGHGKYIFPSSRAPKGDRPMSENTVLVALRSMGYTKDQMTAHGFRSMASTLLNENGFNADWIERQLAHVEGNSVRAAYNYAEYLPERRKMMQWWASYLDGLKEKY